MPAERGPSGTGHDGEGVPTEREWLEGLACQSSYPHEAHGSCPGLRRPSDPPVAVPGPASERDPAVAFCKGGAATCEICVGSCGIEEYEAGPASVSPAETPEAVALRQWILWSARNADEEADGLERLDALLAERERDRRQIARLTEALREAEWHGSAWIGMECCPVCSNEREEGHERGCLIGAVLADEEDAE